MEENGCTKREEAGRILKLFILEGLPGLFFRAFIKLGNNLIEHFNISTGVINKA